MSDTIVVDGCELTRTGSEFYEGRSGVLTFVIGRGKPNRYFGYVTIDVPGFGRARTDENVYADTRAEVAAGLTKIAQSARTALAPQPAPAHEQSGWWCPTCKRSPRPVEVTFEEHHEECGTYIGNTTRPAPDAGEDEVERVAADLFRHALPHIDWDTNFESNKDSWRNIARRAIELLTHRSVAAKVPSVRRPIGEYVAAYNRAYRERMEWFTTTNVEVAPGIKGAAIDVNVCVRAGVKAVLALSLPRAPAKEPGRSEEKRCDPNMTQLVRCDHGAILGHCDTCKALRASPRSAVEAEVVERCAKLIDAEKQRWAIAAEKATDSAEVKERNEIRAHLLWNLAKDIRALARAQEGRGT